MYRTLTILKVGQLEEIYKKLLTSGTKSDLEELSKEEDEYKLSDLKCYLSIGGKGWIEWIENTANEEKAKSTLEWLAENDDVVTILADDTNDGEEIVEALLIKIGDGSGSAGKKPSDTTSPTTASGDDDATGLWALSSDKLIISTHDGTDPYEKKR